MSEYDLKPRERRFADEYIANGRNATQAYKKISPNAKDTTCRTQGAVYLAKPNISSYIKAKTIERLNAANLTAQDVIDQLIQIGFGKPRKGYNKQTDLQTKTVIQEIEYSSTAMPEEQLKALELLGKSMAMFTDRQDISGNLGVVNIIDDIPDDEDG